MDVKRTELWVPTDACTCPWNYCGEIDRDNEPPNPCSMGHRPKAYIPPAPKILTPENTAPSDVRLWVCEECGKVMDDETIRVDAASGKWGRACQTGQRCEAFFAAYVPEEATDV